MTRPASAMTTEGRATASLRHGGGVRGSPPPQRGGKRRWHNDESSDDGWPSNEAAALVSPKGKVQRAHSTTQRHPAPKGPAITPSASSRAANRTAAAAAAPRALESVASSSSSSTSFSQAAAMLHAAPSSIRCPPNESRVTATANTSVLRTWEATASTPSGSSAAESARQKFQALLQLGLIIMNADNDDSDDDSDEGDDDVDDRRRGRHAGDGLLFRHDRGEHLATLTRGGRGTKTKLRAARAPPMKRSKTSAHSAPVVSTASNTEAAPRAHAATHQQSVDARYTLDIARPDGMIGAEACYGTGALVPPLAPADRSTRLLTSMPLRPPSLSGEAGERKPRHESMAIFRAKDRRAAPAIAAATTSSEASSYDAANVGSTKGRDELAAVMYQTHFRRRSVRRDDRSSCSTQRHTGNSTKAAAQVGASSLIDWNARYSKRVAPSPARPNASTKDLSRRRSSTTTPAKIAASDLFRKGSVFVRDADDADAPIVYSDTLARNDTGAPVEAGKVKNSPRHVAGKGLGLEASKEATVAAHQVAAPEAVKMENHSDTAYIAHTGFPVLLPSEALTPNAALHARDGHEIGHRVGGVYNQSPMMFPGYADADSPASPPLSPADSPMGGTASAASGMTLPTLGLIRPSPPPDSGEPPPAPLSVPSSPERVERVRPPMYDKTLLFPPKYKQRTRGRRLGRIMRS